MSKKYLSCAETAKLVRAALKEAFPKVKFSVRSDTYSMGASINVNWTDGPNTRQVEAVAKKFQGSYFDGSIDYQGSIYHMVDGIEVNMGADFIFCNREYSDKAVAVGIARIYRRYIGNFEAAGVPMPTVEDYRTGKLYCKIHDGFFDGGHSLDREVNVALSLNTDRLKVFPSKTCNSVICIGDDGYSRSCGSGKSAVNVEE